MMISHNSKIFSALKNVNIRVSIDKIGSFRGIACNHSKIRSRFYSHSLSFNQVNGKFVTTKPLFKAVKPLLRMAFNSPTLFDE